MADAKVEISPDGRSSVHHYGGGISPTADEQIRRAYQLMDGDPVNAGRLFANWMSQDSELRQEILSELVADYLARKFQAESAK